MKKIIILGFILIFNLAFAAGTRENKRFQVTGSPVGINFTALTQGVKLDYFLSTDHLIGAGFYSLSNLDGNGTGIELYYKNFVSRTFYYQTGLSYRNGSYEESWFFDWDYSDDIKRIQDIAVSFKIGNQWQIGNFVIGCDWFGFSKVIGTFNGDKSASDDDSDYAAFTTLYLGANF